ncbi:MAG: response regulator [SAR324 cluster bacterium]|nr:response regulator [SAR324 cluster bacterium]
MAHILLVDDDPLSIQYLKLTLRELGHTFNATLKPRNVLSMLYQEHFDLILMDIHMPEMNGPELLKALHKTPGFHRIPVIMMTGDMEDQLMVDCFENGAVDYLTKPVSNLVMSARIKVAINTSKYKLLLENNVLKSHEQLHSTETELKRLRQVITQWEMLPHEVQDSMENLLLRFGNNLDYLDEDLKQTLVRITVRYGEMLTQFINIARTHQPENVQIRQHRVSLLKDLPIFKQLSNFDLITLTEKMEVLTLPADTMLLQQDEPAEAVFFIENGTVEILVNDELVAHRHAGSSIGEMSCLRGELKASATVRTLTSCVVLRISREAFMEIVNRLPQLWQNVFQDMTNRFNAVNQRLSEVFQHTPQGMVKVDQKGLMTNEFSTRATDYLGSRHLMGKPATASLFPDNKQLQELWKDAYHLFFEDTRMEFDMLTEVLPRETTIQSSHGTTREIKLSYYPCRDANAQLVAIDIALEDVSRANQMSRQSKQLMIEKQVVARIYDDPESYLTMLDLADSVLQSVNHFEQIIDQVKPLEIQETGTETMRVLHTLKGMSGLFLLDELKDAVHVMETEIMLIREEENPESIDKQEGWDRKKANLEYQIRHAHELFDNINPELRERLMGVVLVRENFEQLKHCLLSGDTETMRKILFAAEQVPALRLAQHWPKEICRLGKQTGKQIKFKLEGERLLIRRNLFDELEGPLVHLLRNSVDHGIELPEERLQKGKNEWGYILFKVSREQNNMVLEVQDDGRGIELDKIVEKARKTRALDQSVIEQFILENTAWKILFLPGFSTASTLTEVSGRGVGLSSVEDMVARNNGILQMETEPGQGTKFRLVIPLT